MVLGPIFSLLLVSSAPSVTASVDAELPHPKTGLPALERALSWIALMDPALSPERIRVAATELGVDPFRPEALGEAGLETEQPMRVKLDPSTRTLSIELAVKDRKRVLGFLDALATKNKDRPEFARWGDAVLIDAGSAYLLAVVLEKKRLFVQLPEAPRLSFFEDPEARMRLPATKKAPKKWIEHTRLGPLAALKKSKKYSPPKLETARRPDLSFRAKFGEDSSAGALLADSTGFELHGLWALDARGQIVLGELASAKSRARALMDEGPLQPALSVRGKLVGTGAQRLIEHLGVASALTKGLPGGFHLVVTRVGELVLELEAGEQIGEPTRALIQKSINERIAAAKVSLDPEEKRLGISIGAVDVAGLRKNGEPESAPLVLDLRPEHVLSVLGGIRDRYGPRYQPNNVQLMGARMVVEPLVKATKSLRVEFAPHGAALWGRADVRYRD